jgi:hypothetical protein
LRPFAQEDGRSDVAQILVFDQPTEVQVNEAIELLECPAPLKLTRFRGHLILTEEGDVMSVRYAIPKPPYQAEFRQQMVQLVHAGRYTTATRA